MKQGDQASPAIEARWETWRRHPTKPATLVYLPVVVQALRNPSLLTPADDVANRLLAAELIEGWGGVA